MIEPGRRAVAVAGHTGDIATALAGLTAIEPAVRSTALGAMERLGELDDAALTSALTDPDPGVRRRAVEIAAHHHDIDLIGALHDDDDRVVEMAAWSCGEHESNRDPVMARLIELTLTADEALVRESAVAALGAIGDERGLPAIIEACADKPAVRRRAVLALAPFDGDDVEQAVERALVDRDWQVRQAAEDLRRASD